MKLAALILLLATSLQAATILSGSGSITMSGSITFNAAAAEPDTTPPSLSTVTIAANGTNWVFAFNEAVSVGAGGSGGMAVTMSTAGAVTLTYASGSGTASLTFNGDKVVYSDETVSAGLDYTQPGNGLEDASGNDLASIDDKAVVNNSSQSPPAGSPYYTETFEATGFDNATMGEWEAGETGVIDPDYGTALAGSQSLRISPLGNIVYCTNTITAKSEVWGKVLMRPKSLTGISRIDFYTTTDIWLMEVLTDGTIRLTQGSDTGVSTATVSVDTTYKVWFRFKTAGDGNDAECWITTGTTRPETATASLSNGNSIVQPTGISFQGFAGADCVWDSLNLYESDPGTTW